jgi:hypothetical protein
MLRSFRVALLIGAALVAPGCTDDTRHDHAPAPAPSGASEKHPNVGQQPAATQPAETPSAVADPPPAPAASAATLTGDSTLAEWRSATAAARSQVAVSLARNRLAADASKLDVAKLAMEITGCVSATARDSRLDGWKVSPTANTCLTAPEREKK